MARITYVKAAQQRYETVPVIDPATGEQKQTPVMRNGKQRTTKAGRPIFLSVTASDKSKPLPNRNCDKCRNEIKVGDPYKHISPRSGPYGGRTLYRCDECPTWHIWEYSSSLSAQLAETAWNFNAALDSVESEDDVQTALNETADEIRLIAAVKEEGADNIESGFGHETQQSEELREIADQLNAWADEIENATIPEHPETEETECEECSGSGSIANPNWEEGSEDEEEEISCDTCDGTGQFTPEEPSAEQIEAWRDEVRSDLSIVDESPV
jgi:hypothetical protein